MRVLGISGSLRADSHNTRLLRRVAEHLPSGAELEIYDGLERITPYSEDRQQAGDPAADELRAAIERADAVVFATPEYNSSIPGQLKNALDWVSRPRAGSPLQNKPAIVLSASTGRFGGVWAQAELRRVLASLGARVIETDFALAKADEAWSADGALADPDLERKLSRALSTLLLELEPQLLAAA